MAAAETAAASERRGWTTATRGDELQIFGKAVVYDYDSTSIGLPFGCISTPTFDSYSTAIIIQQRYDHSTAYVTTGPLHRGVNK